MPESSVLMYIPIARWKTSKIPDIYMSSLDDCVVAQQEAVMFLLTAWKSVSSHPKRFLLVIIHFAFLFSQP